MTQKSNPNWVAFFQ